MTVSIPSCKEHVDTSASGKRKEFPVTITVIGKDGSMVSYRDLVFDFRNCQENLTATPTRTVTSVPTVTDRVPFPKLTYV